MNQRVYIRTDGSTDIGLGHLVRCMSLAHMLKNDFSIHFFALEIPDSLKNEITQNGWEVNVVEKELDFVNELTGDEIVVLDGYQFDSDCQKQIKGKECKLVCIDDFHQGHFYADLVINHAPGVIKDDYEGEPYTKYLLGPDYALLRPEFLGSNSRAENNSKGIKYIFVCFGGSDNKNLTSKILSWLPSKNYSVTAVLGNAYLHQDELNKVIKKREDLKVIVKKSLSAKEMKLELEHSDFAIVPASGILFEVISTKLPAMSGYYIDNQKRIYDGFKALGCIIDAINFSKEHFHKAMHSIDDKSLALIRENQNRAIDGMSMNRINEEFKNLASICL
ncbi:UDP-2,4-diacetamido-2,4,6-trideoxy-beta-L-altropyranose hydrolase [Rhodohalobacter mucosus]|uniref:UDP-2,4-diacetamido-2,4, 6-trideoxy-beta-L-altropyranose hydrolase n=1 Tax=Rhodohalobacter mucosus TaxID=2079485 RepID=A0A316TVS8_9BACT|nr:UDP-2,4-diacetamido-2,4,6-trideoxy-beta-L-altropyranose hydrolase [Rhodohalobacter mucosus]PWN07459.1 UDP-2,4-diacetamido-2,4,6-trideoxy-beta-L-altropyranose hydrolase [Rhodohalobacter mucosus]